MDDLPRLILLYAPPVFALGAAVMAWLTTHRYRGLIAMISEQTEVALDVLDQMEKAHDPGREVQDRLAHAIEARLIAIDRKVEPASRRAAAQVMAAEIIEDMRRANLIVEPG